MGGGGLSESSLTSLPAKEDSREGNEGAKPSPAAN